MGNEWALSLKLFYKNWYSQGNTKTKALLPRETEVFKINIHFTDIFIIQQLKFFIQQNHIWQMRFRRNEPPYTFAQKLHKHFASNIYILKLS
jgi:hypothetical protein